MAFIKTVIASLAFALVAGDHPPSYAPAYPETDPVYNYAYGVNDPSYGPIFSHNENRDNYNTAGEYRVNLPDGRVQIVSYTADSNGYVADIKYEGEAKFPEETPYKPAPYKPAPYKPAPYKPAPYQPAPYKPAPYKPAPYQLAPYKPAPYQPAPYKPAPPTYAPTTPPPPSTTTYAPPPPTPSYAPVYKPVAPTYKPAVPVYQPAPYRPAYPKRTYGYKPITEAPAAPAVEEVSEEKAEE